MHRILLVTLFVLGVGELLARDIFVGGAGASDNNPGTAAQPYATIQKAASVAVAGDVVKIRSGIYRETITVANSGITFLPDAGASVTVSGLNVVDNTGWTVHSGNIYKKSITLPVNGHNTSSTANPYIGTTTILANQIIRNGEMMFEAREPDITSVDDLMKWQTYKQYSDAQGFKQTQINDATLPLSPPALVGATMVSQGWYVSAAGTISAHDNSGGVERIVFPAVGGTTGLETYKRQAYYLTNKLGLLDVEKEFHYENGTLYFYQPGGGSPSGTIEYKARNWGFDIRNRSGIKIIGLEFIGVDPVVGNASSTNALVEKTTAKYNNHHIRHDVKLWSGIFYGMAYNLGTKLLGANSVFKDNVWDISASTMLWMGPNCRVENNSFTNSLYAGNGGGTLIPWENDGGQVITRNTIDNTGMNCIFFGAPFNGSHTNVEISYNKMYNFGRINGDTGATYTAGQTNTSGLNYHHNWIFEGHARRVIGLPANFAIYFDQASGPGTIHHNVVWSTAANTSVFTDIYHEITNSVRPPPAPLLSIYNNTFASTNTAVEGIESSYLTWVASSQDVQRNNIYRRQVNINSSGGVGNNQNYLLKGTNPLFVGDGSTGDGLDFRLQSGSPAINAGQVIGGITDGSVGAPDIGAYEFGGPAWVAGFTPVPFDNQGTNAPPTASITAPANNATFVQGSPITISANASDPGGSVAKVEFFAGTTKLGEDATSPYSYVWNGAAVGTHALTVRVTDNQNSTGTSAAVSVTVNTNAAPTVAITAPADNAQFQTGTAITITATAADANGTVARVEFFNGAAKIGEDLSAPYSFTWNNAPAGSHALTAKATDNLSSVTTSTVVDVTVATNAMPVVSITGPANNGQFNVGAPITITANATDAGGSITKVEFFNGTTKLGEDVTSPYSFTWNNAPAGSKSLTAKATDNQNNVTTSAAVTISVNTNNGPVVSITAPVTGAEIITGTAISITATATDAGGSITKVEFFAGATKLGEDASSPYSFTWNNAPSGTHALTAKATDNLGATGTSTIVNVSVINPVAPTVSAGEDQFLTLPDNSVTITPSVESSSTVTYTWTQIEGPTVSVSSPTNEELILGDLTEGSYVFRVSVRDGNGLTATDEIRITVAAQSEATAASIPRFFSPNDDGTGDFWEWKNVEAYENSRLTIFNRAGQQVFETTSYNNTWDGKLDGQPLADGDYYYVIQLANLTDIRGAVRIIR